MQRESENSEAVREFFDQWALYRKVVAEDYLFHRETMAALGAWMDSRARAVKSFLDLGCGDAFFTSALLEGRGLARYTCVDLSPVALDLARENAQKVGGELQFVTGDFASAVDGLDEEFDVIYIGLSFHHLPRGQKEDFLRRVIRRVVPGGALVLYEPVLHDGESRESYLARWIADARRDWTLMTKEEMDAVDGHITSSDYPEMLGTYFGMATSAGFSSARVLLPENPVSCVLMAFERGA